MALFKHTKSPEGLERKWQGSRADEWPAAYTPFGLMRRFTDDIDRMFEGLGRLSTASVLGAANRDSLPMWNCWNATENC